MGDINNIESGQSAGLSSNSALSTRPVADHGSSCTNGIFRWQNIAHILNAISNMRVKKSSIYVNECGWIIDGETYKKFIFCIFRYHFDFLCQPEEMIKLTFFLTSQSWFRRGPVTAGEAQLTNFKSVETQEFLWQNLEKFAPLSPNTSLYFIWFFLKYSGVWKLCIGLSLKEMKVSKQIIGKLQGRQTKIFYTR